jgi:hypothetical protein
LHMATFLVVHFYHKSLQRFKLLSDVHLLPRFVN